MEGVKEKSSFKYLNMTQSLVTLNDSIFRLIITYSLIDLLGEAASNKILALSATLFILPFILFCMPSGQLADRYSKQRVLMWTVWAELVFIGYGMFAIYVQDVFSCYFALFLVALQSAIFNPVKYSIIPEIEPDTRIAKVNGYLTLATYLSIILGTFLASFLSDITGRNYLFVAAVCFIFSILAIFTAARVKKTPAKDPGKWINPFFMVEVYRALKKASKFPHLLLSIFATSFFLMTAGYTQLNLIPFGMQSLHITDVQTGYVYLAAALGVGTGSFLVSILSGTRIELGLSIWGAYGTGVSYILLFAFQHSLFLSCLMFFSVGMHGGLYVVPLDAYIQQASPEKHRGSIVASSTFVSFASVLIGAAMIVLYGIVLKISAAMGFFIVGWITLCGATFFFFHLANYFTRLIAVLTTRFFISLEVIDAPTQSLLICEKKSFLNIFTLVYAFPNIRFAKFVTHPPKLLGRAINKLFNTIAIAKDSEEHKQLMELSERGYSLCFFQTGDGCQEVGISPEEAKSYLSKHFKAPIHKAELSAKPYSANSFFHFLQLFHQSFKLSFKDSHS